MSVLGQKAKYSLRAHIVRFAPESGLKSDIAGDPFRANNGSGLYYSITLSALDKSDAGTVSPSAAAVLRLIDNSNLEA